MSNYRLTGHEQVHVRHRTPELLDAELLLAPGGRMPPSHRHPGQDEHFHVLEGILRVKIRGSFVDVGVGEDLEIPRETPHTMSVAGDRPVRAVWQTSPALATERWWAVLDAASEKSPSAHIPLPVMARLLRMHQNEFQLALPRPVARALLRLLSLLPPWNTSSGSATTTNPGRPAGSPVPDPAVMPCHDQDQPAGRAAR